MNNPVELLTRAAKVLGQKVVAESINLSIADLNKKMYQAYQSFNDAEYKAWSDIILYKSATYAG